MTVTLHAKEIRITLEEGSLNHLIVKNFVQKYFNNVLTLSSTLVIFHQEAEISQKRYFMQWLYSAYRKKRRDLSPVFLKALQSALHFPIRIRIQGKKNPVQPIAVRVRVVSSEGLELTISPSGGYASLFFRQRLAPWFEHTVAAGVMRVRACEASLAVLSELFKRRQILAQPVTYRYDALALNRLIAQFNAAQKSDRTQKQRSYQLVIEEDGKLKRSYALLGCQAGDSLDQIKQRYRALARRYHPDRAYALGEAAVSDYTRRFHAIAQAYETVLEQINDAPCP
jgi:hypothetical protein